MSYRTVAVAAGPPETGGGGGGPDSGATPPAANRASGLISMQITQPFNRFGIAVIQKTALRTVQRGDHGHVLGIEREAEHVEILRENSPFLPSAKGAHDSICTPFVRMNSAAAVCWWNGWVST